MVYKAIENKMIKIKTKITGEYIIFEGFENGESFWFQKELKKNIVSCSYFDGNLQINYFNDKKINIDFLNEKDSKIAFKKIRKSILENI